jgi:hypothetical protein
MVQVPAAARAGDLSKVPPDECDDNGMIVLLVKQVHLQKDGGARSG